MTKNKELYVNNEIKAPNIIIIDEDGNKLGKFSRKKAMQKAYKEEKDLIQMNYNYKKKISTVKMMEFGKYKYQQQKKEKNKPKPKEEKTIKIGYNIWEHDLNVKIKKIKGLLKSWHDVKIMGILQGREKHYKKTMKEQIKKVARDLSDVSKTKWIKKENNWYSVKLMPSK